MSASSARRYEPPLDSSPTLAVTRMGHRLTADLIVVREELRWAWIRLRPSQ